MIEVTKPRAIALGYFDGVHLGHRAVLSAARAWAQGHGAATAVFTFTLPPHAALKGAHILQDEEKRSRLSACGAEVVDSPGFSSFETEELNLELKHHLPETFREFQPYLDSCRFVGCSHTKEKGCAVLEAVKRGQIQKSRHNSYLRLYEELKPLKDWQETKK